LVSERLNESQRILVLAICRALDGVPYTEKGPIIRASLAATQDSRRPTWMHWRPQYRS
jgi:hypothetical protein